MGNRAIITIEDEDKNIHPVALYVHWNGGLESVEAFMKVAWEAPRNVNSLYDFHISLCHLLRSYWPEGFSLYGHPQQDATQWGKNCDNGHYHYRITQSQPPKLVQWSNKPESKPLNDCVAEARQHKYWTAEENIVTDLTSILSRQQNRD